MPKRTDIQTVLIIGAGPIVIGQACEFDYSGVQAVKALKEEGYRVVLVNSNPATIMTDPGLADATYIEPITPAHVERVIARERNVVPGGFAILPTMGGQTALNCALELERRGAFERHDVEMIGARAPVIEKAEDRELFRKAMDAIGLESPKAIIIEAEPLPEGGPQKFDIAGGVAEALRQIDEIGLPAVIRPAFTLGGTGGGIAYNREEYEDIVRAGLTASPAGQVLIDECLLGWKEFEMEVVRDKADNCIIICSIENIDPMGVHTGDSATVAPALTLTDREYQRMRDASIAVLREIGVETGGSNVQFAIDPKTGRMIVIEMNPRVSRSSALASKATGFPIAKVAAKLAVGYTLDELENEITGGATPASFEPTIDYVVTKLPRFAFEKFPGADSILTTSMKSVGEAMAMGRTFQESLQKALRSLETGLSGLDEYEFTDADDLERMDSLRRALSKPTPDRIRIIAQAMREGLSLDDIYAATAVDMWFLRQIADLVEAEDYVRANGVPVEARPLSLLKSMGFSDARLAALSGRTEHEVAEQRRAAGVRPVYKRVDTCAAEFAAATPYLYSTYESAGLAGAPECEAKPSARRKVIILGGGPNRIGQGIEFDYCCCHAAFGLDEIDIESIMVNCNPETVSTDYDTSDRLYFEPLTAEDVLELIHKECETGELLGVIVQFGGQTPLKLAEALDQAGVPLLGTQRDAIDLAEDRDRFGRLIDTLGLQQPDNAIARSAEEAVAEAERLGFPLVLRPSYVLGGRAMEIVREPADIESYLTDAVRATGDAPLLIDRYLRDAVEVDVDAICDGEDVFISGIMEHIEEAGVHSGDSACVLPPHSLSASVISEIEDQTRQLARALNVRGLMNVQFAVQDGDVFILEVNPRASRTVPFVAKAVGLPIARIATKVMAGLSLRELGLSGAPAKRRHIAVKEAVMPFNRFPGADPVLGPEMRSTGEVMGHADDFETAYAKSQIAAGVTLPTSGTAFVSVKDADKRVGMELARELVAAGFSLVATGGTADRLGAAGIPVTKVNKVYEGRPHIVDAIKNAEVQLICNTTEGRQSHVDSKSIRSTALSMGVPCYTTVAAARAAVRSMATLKSGALEVRPLQSYSTETV